MRSFAILLALSCLLVGQVEPRRGKSRSQHEHYVQKELQDLAKSPEPVQKQAGRTGKRELRLY